MAGVTTRMTAAAFLALPETNLPTQLLGGEVVMTPAPSAKHQRIVFTVAKLVETLASDGVVYLAPVDVYLDETDVVQPDVIWIAPDSTCVLVEDRYWQGAPDLVIEVLSPGTARMDKRDKFRLYETHGVREYWLVDPEAEYIEVWRREEERFVQDGVFGPDESFLSAVLHGQEVKGEAVFKGI
jgi:Uma2 family endonuclease